MDIEGGEGGSSHPFLPVIDWIMQEGDIDGHRPKPKVAL
jgi:hypothetical protein